MKIVALWIVPFLLLVSGCGSDNTLTKQEMQIQSNADIAVSELLFDAGLDNQASYNVRKNGHVEIEFTKGVSMIDYTLIVEKLRKHPGIASVYAVQSGSEVCPLK
ncbi:MAG: hypothetical protein U9R28_01715 [Pseudomonadota bacterium]|nr:hypothetical protein [Pseudomonadota bacterium]